MTFNDQQQYNPGTVGTRSNHQSHRASNGPSRGLAIAALVLGIIGLVLSIFPSCNLILAVPCDILGIIFGAVATGQVKQRLAGGEDMAKAGLICGIVGLAMVLIWFFSVMAWVNSNLNFGF